MMAQQEWPAEDLECVGVCPVCKGNSRAVLYTGLTDCVFGTAPGKWTLYFCMRCKCAYLDPRPTARSIGRAYANYYTHAAEDTVEGGPRSPLVRLLHGWVDDYFNHRFGLRREHAASGGRWLIPLVPPFLAKASARMRHLPPPPAGGGRLLDVGFGNGSFLKIANEMGWNAEGIDFDPQAVEVARARGLNVSCATVADLSTRNEGYDIITLSHVIEHIHDPIALLHNLYQLLKPNGRLWLETPNIASLGAARFGKHWRGLEVPRHLVLFNPTSLCKTLNSVGFRRIEQRWHGMTLFSIYTESATIASGQDGQKAKQYAWLTPLAVIDELREMLQPRKREFITLIAHK